MAHQRILNTRTLLARVLTEATAAFGLAAMALVAVPLPAGSAPQDPIPPQRRPWGYNFGARQPGSRGGSPDKSGGGSKASDANAPTFPPDMCGALRFGVRACNLPQIPTQAPPAPAVTPAELAATAWQQLPLPRPQVATAPPRDSEGLVGLAEWFWVTNWKSHSSRVQAGGVWAEVTARPTSLRINPGARGQTITCAGPGTVYDRTRSAAGQRSACSYTYLRSSAGLPGAAYQVTATVTWGGTWVGSGGTGGTLPALSRSSSFAVQVAEGQAVTK